MIEESSESVTPSETATEAPTDNLEALAQEFNVEEQINNFQAKPEQQLNQQQWAPQSQQPWLPDPIADPDGFINFSRQQVESLSKLDNTVKSLTDKIQSYEQQTLQQKIDADVERAVSKVNEKLKVDPMLAEIALEKMYRTDTNFKKIWDNRDKNPKAFDKALDVLANKLAPTFSVRQDPQLTENQLAAKKSQQTMASTAKADNNAEWEGLSEAEFWQKWNAHKRG